jgi:hypothetical protein
MWQRYHRATAASALYSKNSAAHKLRGCGAPTNTLSTEACKQQARYTLRASCTCRGNVSMDHLPQTARLASAARTYTGGFPSNQRENPTQRSVQINHSAARHAANLHTLSARRSRCTSKASTYLSWIGYRPAIALHHSWPPALQDRFDSLHASTVCKLHLQRQEDVPVNTQDTSSTACQRCPRMCKKIPAPSKGEPKQTRTK